jgi:pteridine reductase
MKDEKKNVEGGTQGAEVVPVALVTGAGRRVGNGIARALAARGYRVALHANASLAGAEQTARELTAAGGEAIAVAADLADEAATREMVGRVRDHFGRLDALVNNAAIWIAAPLERVTADDVRRHFEVNTLGTFVCCREAGLVMVAQPEGGAIVNVGDWAIARPYRDHAAYFASKGSIPTLTRVMAVELAARNPRVRVNAVLPGPVLLPGDTTHAEREQIIESTLTKREGTVEELSAAIVFLLENEFVTGVCLPVDGGRSIFAADA